MTDQRTNITAALKTLASGDLADGVAGLLTTLGYSGPRTLPLSGSVAEFLTAIKQSSAGTSPKSEQMFRREAQAVPLLLQMDSRDIATRHGYQCGAW